MSIQLCVGLLINTISFGIMGFRSKKTGVTTPKFLQTKLFNTPLTTIYFLSFVIILFSPEKFLLKIIIALLMQFIINHIVWGIIFGIITGRKAKNKL
ncbi:MAG: hypothetical protein V1768_01920 [Patescibacteria group bacterium]